PVRTAVQIVPDLIGQSLVGVFDTDYLATFDKEAHRRLKQAILFAKMIAEKPGSDHPISINRGRKRLPFREISPFPLAMVDPRARHPAALFWVEPDREIGTVLAGDMDYARGGNAFGHTPRQIGHAL